MLRLQLQQVEAAQRKTERERDRERARENECARAREREKLRGRQEELENESPGQSDRLRSDLIRDLEAERSNSQQERKQQQQRIEQLVLKQEMLEAELKAVSKLNLLLTQGVGSPGNDCDDEDDSEDSEEEAEISRIRPPLLFSQRRVSTGGPPQATPRESEVSPEAEPALVSLLLPQSIDDRQEKSLGEMSASESSKASSMMEVAPVTPRAIFKGAVTVGAAVEFGRAALLLPPGTPREPETPRSQTLAPPSDAVPEDPGGAGVGAGVIRALEAMTPRGEAPEQIPRLWQKGSTPRSLRRTSRRRPSVAQVAEEEEYTEDIVSTVSPGPRLPLSSGQGNAGAGFCSDSSGGDATGPSGSDGARTCSDGDATDIPGSNSVDDGMRGNVGTTFFSLDSFAIEKLRQLTPRILVQSLDSIMSQPEENTAGRAQASPQGKAHVSTESPLVTPKRGKPKTPRQRLPYMREWELRQSSRESVRECVREHEQVIRGIVSVREREERVLGQLRQLTAAESDTQRHLPSSPATDTSALVPAADLKPEEPVQKSVGLLSEVDMAGLSDCASYVSSPKSSMGGQLREKMRARLKGIFETDDTVDEEVEPCEDFGRGASSLSPASDIGLHRIRSNGCCDIKSEEVLIGACDTTTTTTLSSHAWQAPSAEKITWKADGVVKEGLRQEVEGGGSWSLDPASSPRPPPCLSGTLI